MSKEYYIRKEDSDTAKGPYDISQLQSLAEAGQINTETLYYDDDMEAWTTLGGNEELKAEVFPEKKTLRLRPKSREELGAINEEESEEETETEKVTVEGMLAAAEGQTEDTRHVKEEQKWRDRAATLVLPALAGVMLLSALSNLVPGWSIIQELLDGSDDAVKLFFSKPLLLLGGFDLLLALILMLGATEVYPLLRFRAMIGMGYWGFIYYAGYLHGDGAALMSLIGVICMGLGIFVMTLTLRFSVIVVSAILSLGGIGAYFYFNVLRELL